MTSQPHSTAASAVDFESIDEGSNPSKVANSLDLLIAELSAAGWLFNNCYQSNPQLWRVNLRRPNNDGDWFTDWAEAATLLEALEDCMSKLRDAEFTSSNPITFTNEPIPKSSSLVEQLGLALRPPSSPIKRRV